MKLGTKVYVIENNDITDCEIYFARANQYKLLRVNDETIINIDKTDLNNANKTRFFTSKIVAMKNLEEELEIALDRVREKIKLHKERFFAKDLSVEIVEKEVFPYNKTDIQKENKS